MGCDGRLGSLLTEDLCGVCEGDNSNCTLRQDYYNEKLDRGYQLLVRLYPGTRNFRIKKPDDAFQLGMLNIIQHCIENKHSTSYSLHPSLGYDEWVSIFEYSTMKLK